MSKPMTNGGPVFSRFETLGVWRTETRTLRGVYVARTIPNMLAPRGLNEVILLDDDTKSPILRWNCASSDDVRYDKASHALRVYDMTVALTDESLDILQQDPSILPRQNARDTAITVVQVLLETYTDNGADHLLHCSLVEMMRKAGDTYRIDDVSTNEMIIDDESSAHFIDLLPKHPTAIQLLEPFAHEINEARGMRWSKAWEAEVFADVVSNNGRTVRMRFLVYGDHADRDLVSRALLVWAWPIDGGSSGTQRRVVWEWKELPESTSGAAAADRADTICAAQ